MTREDIINAAKPYTMTGYRRRRAMADSVLKIEAEGIPGDVVECGVWLGGNIIIARKLAPTRICWLFDTFSGMTPPGPADRKSDGTSATERFQQHFKAGTQWCGASLSEVRMCLEATGTLDDRLCRFIEGDVIKTLRQDNIPERIALLRLDTDWYASTLVELEVLYPRLSPGGVLIVDDYGHWQGARKAFHDYFGAACPEFRRVDYTAIVITKSS